MGTQRLKKVPTGTRSPKWRPMWPQWCAQRTVPHKTCLALALVRPMGKQLQHGVTHIPLPLDEQLLEDGLMHIEDNFIHMLSHAYEFTHQNRLKNNAQVLAFGIYLGLHALLKILCRTCCRCCPPLSTGTSKPVNRQHSRHHKSEHIIQWRYHNVSTSARLSTARHL